MICVIFCFIVNNIFFVNKNYLYGTEGVSLIHVNNAKLRNITCTLVATCIVLRRLKCNYLYSLSKQNPPSPFHRNTKFQMLMHVKKTTHCSCPPPPPPPKKSKK